MIAVALPEIRDDFGIGHAEVTWLVSAYLIAMAVAQPLGGRIGDQLGRAKVFRAGLLAFLGFSLAAAAAPSFEVLVALRAAQALVGAAVLPNGSAMIRETVPPHRLGEANGLSGSAIGLSAAVGPVLGALLLGLGSWRVLFLVNIPLVAAALILLALLRFADRPSRSRPVIDWPGAALLGGMLVALTLLLGDLRGGVAPAVMALQIGALAVFTLLFLRLQTRSALPLAEWRLFRNHSYAGATTYILLSNLVMYTTLLAVPFFIKEVQGGSVGTAGFLVGTLSILMSLLAPLSGRLSDAKGRRLPSMAGATCQLTAAALLLAGISGDVATGYLAVALAVMGIGTGLGTGAANTAAVEAAPRELAGVAAGTMSMMRYFGSIVGTGVLGGVLNADAAAPDVDVFRALFLLLTVMAALALLASSFIHTFVRDHAFVMPVQSAAVD
jgi:MFS family permease